MTQSNQSSSNSNNNWSSLTSGTSYGSTSYGCPTCMSTPCQCNTCNKCNQPKYLCMCNSMYKCPWCKRGFLNCACAFTSTQTSFFSAASPEVRISDFALYDIEGHKINVYGVLKQTKNRKQTFFNVDFGSELLEPYLLRIYKQEDNLVNYSSDCYHFLSPVLLKLNYIFSETNASKKEQLTTFVLLTDFVELQHTTFKGNILVKASLLEITDNIILTRLVDQDRAFKNYLRELYKKQEKHR